LEFRQYCPAFAVRVDQFLKEPRWLLEHHRGAGLADRDVCAGGKCSVQTFERHQVAAVINHCDNASGGL